MAENEAPAASESAPSGESAPGALVLVRRWRELESFTDRRAEVRETAHQRIRQRRVFFLLAGFLAIAGAFVGLLSWIHPIAEPYFVPLWITEYESRLIPSSNQADSDRAAIREGGFFTRIDENAFSSQERHLFLQDLAALKSVRSGPVVVYLCAYSCRGEDDEVMLFPADVRPDFPSTRVPLRQVFQLIYDCPASEKLLILDLMRPLATSRLGILENDAAAAVHEAIVAELKRLQDEKKDPRRLGRILTACSPGQEALTSEALGRSVFGFYLEEGLRGWAAGYNDRGIRNNRVTVDALANFVRARVDRWAMRNRNTRQTPELFGSGPNFAIVALKQGQPQPHLELPERRPFPAWLRDGWKLRDAWRWDRSHFTDPHLLAQMEATLLRAEREWHGGIDPARIQNDLKQRFEEFRSRDARARAMIPHPNPRSLEMAVAEGAKVDPAVATDLRTLLQAIEQDTKGQKPEDAAKAKAKLVQAFTDKHKAKSYFEMAWAVFEVLSTEVEPTAAKVILLDELLQQRQPQPTYLESFYIRLLATEAATSTEASWPRHLVRLGLEVARKGGRSIIEPEVFPWVRGLLDAAMQNRYDGNILFFSPGYAPRGEAQKNLRAALDGFDIILNYEETLRVALRLREEAFDFLPFYITYLEQSPGNRATFSEAIHAAIDLEQSLAPPPSSGPPLGGAELQEQIKQIARKSEALRSRLEDLRWPFEAERVSSLIAQSKLPDASAPLFQTMRTILLTPFLRADDHIALWEAEKEMARRLHEATRELDRAEDEKEQRTPRPADFELERARFQEAQRDSAELRGWAAVELFELGGVSSTFLDPVRRTLALAARDKHADAAILTLGQQIREVWSRDLPNQILQETDPLLQSRLSRIVPPLDTMPLVDDPRTNPTVLQRARVAQSMWSWHLSFSHYQSRDNNGVSFFAEVAVDYQRATAGAADVETYLQIGAAATVPPLNRFNPSHTLDLNLTLFTHLDAAATIEMSALTADDDWLRVKPADAALAALRKPGREFRNCTVPVVIELKPGAELSRTPRPRGFMILTQVNGRTFHYRVPIPTLPLPADERVEALLSANPAAPTAPIDGLRLRPIAGRQPYYLFVRNTTKTPRIVLVQIKVKDAVLKGGEAKVTVPPNSFLPVIFPPTLPALPPAAPAAAPTPPAPAPAAPAALPELAGPLHLVVVDAAKPTDVLDEKIINVDIASPHEYVQVKEVRFSPPSAGNAGKNRLEVRLRPIAPLGAAPCRIQLVLPPERIPGFRFAKDGVFIGNLPSDGSDLVLYANNIGLDEGSSPEGHFYLNVDGLERAFIFQCSFARVGEPTTPQEDHRPAIHLQANRFSRSVAAYPVRVDVDNPPPGAKLEVSLSRDAGGAMETDIVQKVAYTRSNHLGFTPQGSEGTLQFEAAIRDVKIDLNSSGIQGPPSCALLLNRNDAPLDSARLLVTFDDSPPDRLRFVAAPAEALKTALLPLKARGEDGESGISKVVFFVGKSVDNKIPPMAPTAEAKLDAATGEWRGNLQLMGDRRGPTDISVQFTNGVGESSFAGITVDLLDGPKKPGPGRIAGVVREGDRPQGGLEVALTNTAAKTPEQKKPKMAKTKPDGTFAFEELAPGNYTVSATKIESGRKGSETVVVEADKTTDAVISLLK